MRNAARRFWPLLALGWSLIAACGAVAQSDRTEFRHEAMGTTFRIVVSAADTFGVAEAAQAAFARVDQIERVFSDYDPESEVMQLVAAAPEMLDVSGDLWRLLERSRLWHSRSDGAFDITIGALSRAWRQAAGRGEILTQAKRDSLLQFTGWAHVRAFDQAVALERPGMRLDFGGIAKGMAADDALAVMARWGFPRTLIDAGGDVTAGAPPEDASGWTVRVEDGPDGIPVNYLIAQSSVATSGATYRYVEVDGVRYSHILDPATGLGLTDHRIVTVFAPNGTDADALASALSVLPPERGLQVAEEAGVAAIITIPDENGRRTWTTGTLPAARR